LISIIFLYLGLTLQASEAKPKAIPSILGPCHEVIEKLPTSSLDPTPYFAAVACLIGQDSSTSRPRIERGGHLSASDSILKARLPNNENWYLTQLERFRLNRDILHIQQIGYLAELKNPMSSAIYHLLAEAYQIIPDPYRAGLAYLKAAELDSLSTRQIQYQLETLLRTVATEIPPALLLDSLTSGYVHTQGRTAELLETLGWSNRNYPGAFANFNSLISLQKISPVAALERVNRFQSLGYFDDASAILEKLGWRQLTQPSLSMARTLFLQIRYQLKDWSAITSVMEGPNGVNRSLLSEEETYIVATALLKLGQPDQTLLALRRLEEKPTPAPWGFRGRLLKAQALMSLGKSKESGEVLSGLKRDPLRQEGTGPILFWQGCLAIDQNRFSAAESLMVLASAYTGSEEAQRALEYRFFLFQDTGSNRPFFFKGLTESPRSASERLHSLDKVAHESPLWPHAQLEKAQIFTQIGLLDSAEAVLEDAAKHSPDKLTGFQAEAKAAFLREKRPGGRQAALVKYEDLLIKYQQGVIPEFSRGRIKALK
jgi:tetratricopeptide (TPR) repeat protein